MIKDYTTGKTKFVMYIVNSLDGRFDNNEKNQGGIDLKSALHEIKFYDKQMIICIFDSEI